MPGQPTQVQVLDTKLVISALAATQTSLPYTGGVITVTATGVNLSPPLHVGYQDPGLDNQFRSLGVLNIGAPGADGISTATAEIAIPANPDDSTSLLLTLQVTTGLGVAPEPIQLPITVGVPQNLGTPGDTVGTGIPATAGQGLPANGRLDTESVPPMYIITGNRDGMPDVVLRTDNDYDSFTDSVYWNGDLIFNGSAVGNAGQFTSSEGSTVVRLHAGFLRTQPNGTYRVRLWFKEGYVDFLVKLELDGVVGGGQSVPSSPQTGDTSPATLPLVALAAVSGLVLLAAAGRKSRRRQQKPQ